jgi:hypothetical protein
MPVCLAALEIVRMFTREIALYSVIAVFMEGSSPA